MLADFLPELNTAFMLSSGAIFIAGMVRGFAGFGSALVMVPCIAMLYSPITAIIVEIIIDGIGGVQMLPMALRDSDRKTVLPLALAAIIGIPTGAYFLISLDAVLIKQIMAIAVLFFVFLLAIGWKIKGEQTFLKKIYVGFISGLLGGSTGFSGPPVILYLMSSGQNPRILRASISMFFVFTSIIAVITFSIAGVFLLDTAIMGLVLTPFFLMGIFVGNSLFHLATEKLFKNVALIILTIVGVTTFLNS